MTTRFCSVAIAVVCFSATTCMAQPSAATQRAEMKKLDFLIGEWKGEGWMEFAPGQRRTFRGTEVVQSKLDGLLLTIEGIHRGQVGGKGEEVIVHSAFALVSYDDKMKRYRFQAFSGRGGYEDSEAIVSEGPLIWGMNVPQFGDVRYTIKRDAQGRWLEIGEVSQDGKEWRKFFEMTLESVKAK